MGILKGKKESLGIYDIYKYIDKRLYAILFTITLILIFLNEILFSIIFLIEYISSKNISITVPYVKEIGIGILSTIITNFIIEKRQNYRYNSKLAFQRAEYIIPFINSILFIMREDYLPQEDINELNFSKVITKLNEFEFSEKVHFGDLQFKINKIFLNEKSLSSKEIFLEDEFQRMEELNEYIGTKNYEMIKNRIIYLVKSFDKNSQKYWA